MNTITSRFGLNASYVQALKAQWEKDPSSVAYEWQTYFEKGGNTPEPTSIPSQQAPKAEAEPEKKKSKPPKAPLGILEAAYTKPLEGNEVEPIRGIAAIIAENMEASLGIPTAMSTRRVPMKVLEENRRVINTFLSNDARKRASYTHLIAWALVRAAREVPSMNNGYTVVDGKRVKITRSDVNLGLAVDLPGRDGSRTLVVPNIKATNKLDFKGFLKAYNQLIARARKGKLTATDFQGTTITLTNPGGAGTIASAPRLMPGQGTIIATGAIGYPAEYEATSPETLRALGIGKSVTMTSTYDHRVIQGAESGSYLKFVHELLNGGHDFYDEVFRALGIPHHPYRLEQDLAGVGTAGSRDADVRRAMNVSQLIHAYRVRGHLLANVDPLDLQPRDHPELNFETYGLTIWDLDREFSTMGVLDKETAPFREILTRLRDIYCQRTGVEYMYMPDVEQKQWMQARVEQDKADLTIEEKRGILEQLSRAQGFERFLHKRYMGHKRFSVEGAESVIPMLDEVLAQSASYGASDAIIGMAHRGRLNVLANIMGKSYEAIFAEFDDINLKSVHGSGDVKYHLGAKSRYRFKGKTTDLGVVEEREVRVELACNPSHLEAVNPVVLGQCRARQDLTGDKARENVVPILIHGDAAFAGQGVVYETLQLSYLQGYRVGGAIHIVINNQIGYTTGPERARTSPNCSDIARVIMAPIFRVNGDDPEACIRAVRMAVDYRMRFHRDVVIDMVCYRKYGHNEGDEPGFTQPILYRAIRDHESVAERYGALLMRRGDLQQEDVDAIEKATYDALERAFGAVKERGEEAVPESSGPSHPGEYDEDAVEEPDTRASMELLNTCVERITDVPEGLNVHPRLKKNVLDRRREMWFEGKLNVDVGLAENLAYATLVAEGIPVRITGQDCGRGTFAHRHAILYDYDTGDAYVPLDNLDKHLKEGDTALAPSRFRIYDSNLSEEAVLGFEYGYSVTHPDSLVLWEAQFGDFFNGAQIQVDQFIAAGEAKWGQKSRVTMLLPHGYDGQGPEHSSARVERFLQMCAHDNMRVAICSTPAQYFHLLRRQAKQPKHPLIVFTHKSLLRADDAGSKPEELSEGKFNVVLDDLKESSGHKKRVVLCTGKFFWDLHRARADREAAGEDLSGLAIIRLEQLYPFPGNALAQMVEQYTPDEIIWAQEEPRNMGAWDFLKSRFEKFGLENVGFVGRPNAASPAAGSKRRHSLEQEGLVKEALTFK